MITSYEIYSRLPTFMQSIVISLLGLKINLLRYDRRFWWFLKKFREIKDTDLKEYKNELFKELIAKIKSDPIGRKRFDFLYGAEVLDNLRTLDDLKALRFVNKYDMRRCLQRYPIDKQSEKLSSHTSGTTGTGLVFPTNRELQSAQWAIWWRYRQQHGIKFNQLCGYFGGREIVPVQDRTSVYRINFAARQIMFSGYHLSVESCSKYADVIKSKNVRWLHGYPSLISKFASICLEQGIDLSATISIVTLGAESLLESQKCIIERAFKCKVAEHYGLAEGVANISQSTDNGLLVDEEFSHVEFIGTEGQYEIVGTNLFNYQCPFIRYQTGDLVSSVSVDGTRRKVDTIDGRVEDYIIGYDGTIYGRLDHIFKDCISVREAQIIQSQIGKIDVKIVRELEFKESDEAFLKKQFELRLTGNVEVEFCFVDNIERTGSGKLRFVISKLDG